MAELENQSPSSCNGNCGSCGSDCASRHANPEDFRAKLADGCSVKKVIGVVSGKGGVGKSTITSLLACGTHKAGFKTAILDADITGPSIPKAFGLSNDGVGVTPDGKLMIPDRSADGIEIIS